MAANLLSWCVNELESRFGLTVSVDIVQYILSIDTEEEIEDYINDLVQDSEERKQMFIRELKIRWQRTRQPSISNPANLSKKDDMEVSSSLLLTDQPKRGRRKGRNKMEPLPVQTLTDTPVEEVKTPMDLAKAQETAALSSSKKKQKFVNLYTKEGQDRLTVLIPGRYACECLAQKHKLVNNCMTCGRIVCEQEGSGPCLFCGSLVCTKEEQDILMRDSNKSQKLRKKLMGGVSDLSTIMDASSMDLLPHQETRMKAGLERALQHRDKLLDYDKTSVRRTHVIDDESDYFSTDSNQWLSTAERETLRKKEQELQELRHVSRLSRKVTIDFAGRKVLEEEGDLSEYHKRFDETVQAVNSGTIGYPAKNPGQNACDSSLVNPTLKLHPPMWVDQVGAGSIKKQTVVDATRENTERNRLRIQDRELQEISDQSMCLSMHQPWASLLIAGIKRVEGRTWYSAHRGRLWIAAAAKRPSPQEISELEASYRVLLNKGIDFPNDYPTGCLLGCVEVVDCLSQEQYREQYPSLSQESGSPFVFVCTNPQALLIKFPIKGQHKIWKLDSKIHQGAKKGLMFRKEKAAQQ